MSQKVCVCSVHSCVSPLFSGFLTSLSVCIRVSARERKFKRATPCLQCLTVITYIQRWHLIHANKSPRTPSAFCQAYPTSRHASTQAGVIKANRWPAAAQWRAGAGHSTQFPIPAVRGILRDNNNLHPHFRHSERNSIENSESHFHKSISFVFTITEVRALSNWGEVGSNHGSACFDDKYGIWS